MIPRLVRPIVVSLALLASGLTAQAGYINWQFNYTDSAGTGFNEAGALGASRRAALQTAANMISGVIGTSGAFDATLRANVGSITEPGSYLASAGATYPSINGIFTRSIPQQIAQDNLDFGTDAAMSVTWNFGYNWGYDSVAGSEFDFVHIALHELIHGLGMDGFITSDGTSREGAATNQYSQFDRFVWGSQAGTYTPLIQTNASGNPTGPISGAAQALIDTSSPLQFRGENAMAANGGNPVSLVTLNPFNDGSSIYHVNDPGDLMFWQVSAGPKSQTLSAIDVGILRDLGYASAVPIPEPGSAMLMLTAAPGVLFLVYRRQRRQR